MKTIIRSVWLVEALTAVAFIAVGYPLLGVSIALFCFLQWFINNFFKANQQTRTFEKHSFKQWINRLPVLLIFFTGIGLGVREASLHSASEATGNVEKSETELLIFAKYFEEFPYLVGLVSFAFGVSLMGAGAVIKSRRKS